MEQRTDKTGVLTLRQLHAGTKTVRVECEGVMPDYCDDIRRVIRAWARAHIVQKRVYVSEGKLFCDVEGSVAFHLIYRGEADGEESGIFSHTFTQEFQDSEELPWGGEAPETFVFSCEAETSGVTCRPLSARKPDFSASLKLVRTLHANVPVALPETLSASLETMGETTELSALTGVHEESFRVEEEILLPHDYAPISTLLDCDIRIHPSWVKSAEGQLVFGARASLSCCYIGENAEGREGSLQSFSQPIELSELVELEACAKDSVCEVLLEPQSLKVQITEDSYGARRVLRVECSYQALCAVYETREVFLLTDAYAVSGLCEARRETLVASRILPPQVLHKEVTVDFPCSAGTSCVENTQADLEIGEMTLSENTLSIAGKLHLSALAKEESGQLVPITHTQEIALSIPVDLPRGREGVEPGAEVRGGVHSALGKLSGGKINVQTEFCFFLVLQEKTERDYISELLLSEDAPADSFRGIRFYYPAPGETLWEIGKRFSISRASIREQNALTQEERPLPAMLKILV